MRRPVPAIALCSDRTPFTMALTRQRRKPPRPELNMASMIDVVFLLLIFFMCTSSFEMLENDMPTQMPQAGAAEQDQAELEPVRIHLSRAGAATVIKCGDETCSGFVGLGKRLRALRAVDDVPVVIEGEGAVSFGEMVAALDACYQANLRRVAFSAKGLGQ